MGSLSVVALLVIAIHALVGWMLCEIAKRMLALRVVGAVAMEGDWETAQEWKVRAMAAVLYRTLPRWLKISEVTLADVSVNEWRKAVEWYRKHQPREDTALFGCQCCENTGPW